MTIEEFRATVKRITKVKTRTFEQWAADNQIELPPEHINAILDYAFCPSTRSAVGKRRTKVLDTLKRQQLFGRYQKECPEIEVVSELDLTKEADRAYLRCQEKRWLRAISAQKDT